MADYELTVYSYLPYVKKNVNPAQRYTDRLDFIYAFKNGKPYNSEHSFENVLKVVTRAIESCPFISGLSPVVLPVPRSGKSQPSTDPNASEFPCRDLAARLCESNWDWEYSESLNRTVAIEPSSVSQERSVERHLNSMNFELPDRLKERHILLLDDIMASGCQLMACKALLRKAGHIGPVSAFVVGQVISPYGHGESDLKDRQIHKLTWFTGNRRPRREDLGVWGSAHAHEKP